MGRSFKELSKFIGEHEEWLMERILCYAKKFGFTEYTSTLLEAWRLSISGLSNGLLLFCDQPSKSIELNPHCGQQQDAAIDFGVREARLHRKRGVDLGMFLSLFQYYKQCYHELVSEKAPENAEEKLWHNIIERYFNRIEVAFCSEWSKLDDSESIQELQQTNRFMTNEKNKYLTAFESSPIPTFLLDESFHIKNLNKEATLLFTTTAAPGAAYYGLRVDKLKHDATNLVGMPIDSLYPWIKEALTSFAESNQENWHFDQSDLNSDTQYWYSIRFSKMLDVSNKFDGIVVSMEDITERVKTQQKLSQANQELTLAKQTADKANQAKTNFLACMSHELRTPLNGIIGMAEAILNEPDPQKQSESLQSIVFSGNHLKQIVDQILSFASLEMKKVQIDQSVFAVKNLIHSLQSSIEPLARKKGLVLFIECEPNIPDKLIGDCGKLNQIIFNLMGNAIKFTSEGKVGLKISKAHQQDSGPSDDIFLKFEVSDTGIGIPEDKKQLIFQRFQQADDTIKRKYGGTGLGLAITSELVQLMQGQLWVESNTPNGSVFCFLLHFQSPKEQEKSAKQSAGSIPKSSKPLNLLVVDDNLINVKVLEAHLKQMGHNFFSLTDPSLVFDSLQHGCFDALLLDLEMPELDGFTIAKYIRNRVVATDWNIPIIAVTAHALQETLDKCQNNGINEVLHKPIDAHELHTKLEKIILEKEHQSQLYINIHEIEQPDISLLPWEDAAKRIKIASGQMVDFYRLFYDEITSLSVMISTNPNPEEIVSKIESCTHNSFVVGAERLRSIFIQMNDSSCENQIHPALTDAITTEINTLRQQLQHRINNISQNHSENQASDTYL
jgi:signal transduction histidine kinase/DNA-binding LytR/AlgR family response regulator